MLLLKSGATCYYETPVQHVTTKLRCNLLLLNSRATCYYETPGAKSFSKTHLQV